MERKIGEMFDYKGTMLCVKEHFECSGCYLKGRCDNNTKDITGQCGLSIRTDNKAVIFVKHKTDESPKKQEEPKETVNKSVLEEALEIVNGSRNVDYGDPVISFIKIGKIATLISGEPMTPIMCCAALMAVKIERESYKHKRDNLVDLCGYTEIMNRLIESETKE